MKINTGSFVYEPRWNGNRELPPEERCRVTVRPWTGRDMLADQGPAALRKWATEHLTKKHGIKIPEDDTPQMEGIRVLKIVCEHTGPFENFEFPDGPQTEPAEVFVRLPWKLSADQDDTLLFELWNLIQGTSGLTEEQVKNFVERFDGRAIQESGSATSAEGEADRAAADTPPERGEPSTSEETSESSPDAPPSSSQTSGTAGQPATASPTTESPASAT